LIRRGTSRRFVAWLAIAAMWLLVVAPTVSRVLPAWMAPDLSAWCTGHGFDDEHPSTPTDLVLHIDKCGYCTLLGHTPLAGGGTAVLVLATLLPDTAPVVRAYGIRHAQPLLSANPRGPPSRFMG
jgi:hypothetical protein